MQEILLSIDQNIYLALSIAFITCLVIFSISYALHSYEKLMRANKFAKFADIEKKQKAEEFNELSVNYKTSTEIVESLTDECYSLICRNTELMKAFEQAAAEIKVLKNRLSRQNAKRDEKGRFIKNGTVKEVDSEWWQCINQHYLNFNNGQTYKKCTDSIENDKSLIWLFEHEDHLHPYLVEKKYFKPVKK